MAGDGFEQILTKIADGEFDSEENEENSEPESEEIATVEDEVVPVEEEVSVEEEEEDKKADELMELTKDMSKNIEKLPQEMQMNIKDFLEMMYLMYQMMKKEKNKRKKASFFEFLLKLVGTFLESLADPETLDKKVQEKENVQDVDDSQEMPSFEEFLKSKGLDLAA